MNLSRHINVVRALGAPVLLDIPKLQPQIFVKYLNPAYLALDLSKTQRAEIFIYHYASIQRLLSKYMVKAILFGGYTLWSHRTGDDTHAISLHFSNISDHEGELTLVYQFNNAELYGLGFSFASGQTLGAMDETVMFLTRLQGITRDYALIRAATRSMLDIAPAFALFSALQGMAEALGIRHVAGVPEQFQASFQANGCYPHQPYTRFFTTLGAQRLASSRHRDYFYLALPLAEKPVAGMKSHRLRKSAKRQMKHSIRDAACQAMTHPPA